MRGALTTALSLVESVLGQRHFSGLAWDVAHVRDQPVSVNLADTAQGIGQRDLKRLRAQVLYPLGVNRGKVIRVKRESECGPVNSPPQVHRGVEAPQRDEGAQRAPQPLLFGVSG